MNNKILVNNNMEDNTYSNEIEYIINNNNIDSKFKNAILKYINEGDM